MYGITNQEGAPAFKDPLIWDEYMAHLWYNLLYFCNINAQSTLIEVGPGTSTKIPRALAKLSFMGSVHLVEPHLEIGSKIKDAYISLLPKAKIVWHANTLDKVIDQLPKHVDAILGNHVLDDMLLLSSNTNQLNDFDWARKGASYCEDTERFQATWAKIKNNKHALTQGYFQVLDTWQQTIATLCPQNLILSQYKSYYLSHSPEQSLDQWGWKIMRQLKEIYSEASTPQRSIQLILNGMKNYNDSHLGLNVLNAKHWVLWEFGSVR